MKKLLLVLVGIGLSVMMQTVFSKDFKECNKELDADVRLKKFRDIPENDAVLRLRGKIAGADIIINALRNCSDPRPQAQDMLQGMIAEFTKEKNEDLRKCQQLSARPSECEISPLNAPITNAENSVSSSQTQQNKVATQKLHNVLGANASNCLSLSKKLVLQGGFNNSCPYVVEFYYCAYHPRKNAGSSWSDAFDCEKKQMGLMHAPANSEITAHTLNAEQIHWFGCKYGDSLNKPNGISAKDVTFNGSRLVGRCGED